MTLTKTSAGEIEIVHIQGRLDAQTAPALEAVVQAALDKGVRKLVIDCQGMNYVSSMGLRVFMVAGKLLVAREGVLAFASLNPQNSHIFKMTSLSRLFPCFSSLHAAFSELAK